MSNTQIAITAGSVAVTLIVALWGIAERNTSRLVDQFDKRMTERDEKLLAKLETLRFELLATEARLNNIMSLPEARIIGTVETLRVEIRGERETLRGDVEHLKFRIEQLERRAA